VREKVSGSIRRAKNELVVTENVTIVRGKRWPTAEGIEPRLQLQKATEVHRESNDLNLQ
jgi:hypothetical protein